MRQRTSSFTRVLPFLVAVSVLSACATADSRRQAAVKAFSLPGDLAIAYNAISPDSLWKVGDELFFVGTDTSQRRCAQGKCDAQILAVANQKFDSLNVSANGTIVAKLLNLGRKQDGADMGREELYGFGRTGVDTVYYLIAHGDGTGSNWRWSVRKAVKGITNGVAEEAGSGSWRTCNHKAPKPAGHPKAKSKFWSCDELEIVATGTKTAAAGARDPEIYPGWLDCSAGCCTAGQ